MAGLGIIGVIYSTGGVYVISWVIGPQFHEAFQYLPFLVLAEVFRGWYRVFVVYLFYERKTGIISMITTTSGVVHVGLLFVLVGRLGVIGAPLAYCASSFLTFMLIAWSSNRIYPMPWLSLWNTRKSRT